MVQLSYVSIDDKDLHIGDQGVGLLDGLVWSFSSGFDIHRPVLLVVGCVLIAM